ncbi:TPA: hypothetical protein DEP81_01845 [Candidatus Woesebacteria bacterium]|nr:hypothetical protein [Candidatus Woesebacteria bacterium]
MGIPFISKALQALKYPFQLMNFSVQSSKYRHDLPVPIGSIYPCLSDNTDNTGFDRHYVFHTAWAARKLVEINPKKHFDISSSLYFVAIASAFIPIDFYDYRPADLNLKGLSTKNGDLLKLPFKDSSIESISSMHVIEHIGLGRYGDPLDINGDKKAIKELIRVTKKGGSILFVVPIGKPKVAFNAHRIYSYAQIIKMFGDSCLLREFSLITDKEKDGGMLVNPPIQILNKQKYGCGCFWFTKIK